MTGPADPADAADPGDGEVAGAEPAEAAPGDGAPVAGPEAWNIVAVADVAMNLPSAHPEIVLHEAQHPWRELRIPVGLAEGTAIAYAFRGVETPRPLSHELFSELLDRHGVTIEAVRITVRRGQVFFAELDTMGPKGRRVVPCRPSDAIALALRQRMPTPLLVAEWVFTGADAPTGFTSAGTTPGADRTEP
jgi:bifunctional DNase/RNase